MATFATLAPTYDSDFTHTVIGRYLREKVHRRLLAHFKAGDRVLELGCGTGEDALFLAEQGIHITATDTSEEMLTIARQKTQYLETVTIQRLDLRHPVLESDDKFDGVFSNFGALNCLDSWHMLSLWLSGRVKKRGIVAFGVMSPYCLWELLWFGLHGDFETALRRLRGSRFGDTPITYPTVKRLTHDFLPYFKQVSVKPLGLFLPPSNAFAVVEKRPKLLERLTKLEDRFGDMSVLVMLADHYWIEFQKQ